MFETTNQSNTSHQDFGSSMETGPWQAMARLGSRRQVQDWSPTGSHVRCTQSSSPRGSVDLLNFCIMNRCDIYIYTHIYPYIPIYNPINYICTQTLKNPEHFYAVPFQTKVAGSKSHGDESSNVPWCQELCQPKVEERWSRCYLWHLVASFAAVTADI